MKDRRERKKREVIYPDYQTRIRGYNTEKQQALLSATSQEEVERIVKHLREKWRV